MTLASPVERREFVRIETWTTAHIIATGADGPAALQGTAINISLGGCAIKVAGAAQLAPGLHREAGPPRTGGRSSVPPCP